MSLPRMSNYPGGFTHGVTIREMPVLNFHAGNVYWVDSNGGGGSKGTFKEPCRTWEAAYDLCTADNDDIIMIKPGHTETLTGDASISLDTAGVSTYGLGVADSRPTFLLDASTGVDIDVTGDDNYIGNCIFQFGHDGIAECFDLDATNFILESCKFEDNTSSEHCKIIVNTDSTANACDGLTVKNCWYDSPDTGNTNFVKFNADCDGFVMENCYFSMGVNNSNAVIEAASSKDLTNCLIVDNYIYRLNTAGAMGINFPTSSNSGIICRLFVGHADASAESCVAAAGCRIFEYYATAVNSKQGYFEMSADG